MEEQKAAVSEYLDKRFGLYLIELIPWLESQRKKRGRPYVYPPTVILRCFVVRI
jgi:hypothetical protein